MSNDDSSQGSNQNQEVQQKIKHWILDKDAREGRSLMLQEFAIAVGPHNEVNRASFAHSVTYGTTGIQAAYILNGGALAALPLLLKGGKAAIVASAIIFVFGIVSAGAATLFAYANFQTLARIASIDGNESAIQLAAYYGYPAESSSEQKDKRGKLARRVNLTLWVSVISAVGSLVLFACGVIAFIALS